MSNLLAVAALVALFPSAASADATPAEALAAKLPGIDASQLSPTPVPGLWEISFGAQVAYISEDGRYLVRGDIVDMRTDENISDTRRAELASGLVGKLDESRMVVFSPAEPRYTITVFTDIDCGYCRRFHREIEEYTSRGIKVRYLFYPLAGPDSPSWAKADAVWCSKDRQAAMTRAKLGEEISAEPCGNTPAAEHYQLASEFGARGTPAILTEQGELLPGYVPADRLLEWLASR